MILNKVYKINIINEYKDDNIKQKYMIFYLKRNKYNIGYIIYNHDENKITTTNNKILVERIISDDNYKIREIDETEIDIQEFIKMELEEEIFEKINERLRV
ncbi:MAG: hypothetical protein ACQEQF_00215 [Bacillota bacterium]